MDRREFLVASGGGIGLLSATSLTGCSSTGAGDGFDPGPYVVGDELLAFDENGEAVTVDVDDRQLVEADGDVAVESVGQMPGNEPAQWNHAMDASVGDDGRMYVLDHGNSCVHVYTPDGSYIGAISEHGPGDTDLNLPQDVLVHGDRVYVCDTMNHRVQVFDLDGNRVTCCEGGADQEQALNAPRGIAIASNGELHVVDSGNARVQVFDPQGRPLRTYGTYGTEPGQMFAPRAIVAIAGGRMAVADPVSGHVNYFSESGAFIGRFIPMADDGRPGTPVGLAVMPDGRLYIYTDGLRGFEGVPAA